MNPWPFHRVLVSGSVQSSDDSTYKLTLPLTGAIHTLLVKIAVTNGATSTINQDIADVVDYVEVIANGSDVIKHLTVEEIRRWAMIDTGRNVPEVRSQVGGAVQSAILPVMFGRWPLDNEYWLPAKSFADLELRVKYSPTIAATAFATGTVTVSVLALMTQGGDPGPYRGTICTRTLKNFTSAASGDETTLLPRGNVLRRLMVYAYEAGIEPGANITNVKFDLNNDERVMYNHSWIELAEQNQFDNWIEPEAQILALMADDEYTYTKLSNITNVQVHCRATDDVAGDVHYFRNVDAVAGDKVTIQALKGDFTAGAEDLTTDATGRQTDILVKGRGLPHAVLLDFTKLGESALLNTAAFDQVRLTLTNGNAGAAVYISAEEVRSFGLGS